MWWASYNPRECDEGELACVHIDEQEQDKVPAASGPSALQLCLRGSIARDRQPVQHVALGLHMRACKARKRQDGLRKECERSLDVVVDQLRHRALRVDARVARKGHALTLCITGGGIQSAMTPKCWMRMAFDEQHCGDKCLARRYGCSPKTVRECLLLVAGFALSMGASLSNRLVAASLTAPSCGQHLAFAMFTLAWDETSRLLTMPFAGLCQQQRRSRWSVLVSTNSFDILWCDAMRGNRLRYCWWSPPRANVALLGTSSECLADGLFKAPAIRDHGDAAMSFFKTSTCSAWHITADGAASNRRLIAHKFSLMEEQNPKTLCSSWECALHGNHLVVQMVLRPFLDVISKIYAICALCSMGANFLRLLNFIPSTLDKILVVKHGEPPRETEKQRALRTQWLSYIRFHCVPLQSFGQQRGKQSESNQGKVLIRAWEQLFQVLNDDWSLGVIHWCPSAACCINRRRTIAKLTRLLLSTSFQIAPRSPEV
jgi:hypothetical protein